MIPCYSKLYKFPFIDPFETRNRVSSLTAEEKSYLHDTLQHLKSCRGKSCTLLRNGIINGGNEFRGPSSNNGEENNYAAIGSQGVGIGGNGHRIPKRKFNAMGEIRISILNYIFIKI